MKFCTYGNKLTVTADKREMDKINAEEYLKKSNTDKEQFPVDEVKDRFY